MKVTHQLGRLEPMVLHPLRRLSGDDWHRAPGGKWSVAQIVEHLAIGIDLVGGVFERRATKTGMSRRSTPMQSMLRHMLLGVGRIPPGFRAPEASRPSEQPDPELVAAQFRMGVDRLRTMVDEWPERRQCEVFVRHPIMGDLNLPEWARFHYVHCRHHAGQIRKRLDWLGNEGR